jgi:transcriptional regulator with XRE-family HTH domain
MTGLDAANLVRDARTKAGLSQRELARRAKTAQSVVARIEGGQTSPSWDTLNGLLAAAGFGVETRLAEPATEIGSALDDAPRILSLSAEDRLHELRNADRFLSAIRRG